MSTTFRLGDTVSGEYFDVPFTGIITGFDGSGWVYIATKITVFGIERDSIGLDPYQRGVLRLVQRGDLHDSDVRRMPPSVLGGEYLSKAALARMGIVEGEAATSDAALKDFDLGSPRVEVGSERHQAHEAFLARLRSEG